LGQLATKGIKAVSNYPVFEKDFCAWVINLDWVSLIICYPFSPMQEQYGTQWNMCDNKTSLKLGKIT